jgi:cytochrome c biogenesis protein CcmG, thiol:disulfide interchange protein DsbE
VTRIRWATIAVAVFVVALGAVFVMVVGGGPKQQHGSLLNRPAPTFALTNVNGSTPVTSQSLQGRTVVVNFWNTWCIPCRQEHPALVEFYDRHRDDPSFAMVGIVREDDEKTVRAYVERQNVEWTVAMDPKGAASIAYGTTGQPETYVIGPDGTVHAELFGPASVNDLETMLAAAQRPA